MHSKLSSSTTKCPWHAKAKNCIKTRIPIYSALGPFPDEPLLSSIDRLLFWFGYKKTENDSNSESSCKGDYRRSHSSAEGEKEHKMHHNNEGGECLIKESPTYSVITDVDSLKSSKCNESPCKKLKFPDHCSNSPETNVSRLENSCREESEQIEKPLRTIRRSFSLCSLACRKLREKLKFAETISSSKTGHSPKWLWTKMESYDDGIQVFEVFKNSCAASHPTKFDTSKAPKIIFIILPTGFIMPFETLPRH